MFAGAIFGAVAALSMAGCGQGSPAPSSTGGDRVAGKAAESRPDAAPFVVFTEQRLVIPRLGVPVPAPVTVGSTPSRETIESDAPDVVSVDPNGSLVGLRPGHATITARGPSGGRLAVDVTSAAQIEISPREAELRPGESLQLHIRADGAGNMIPPEAAMWVTTAPEVATVIRGRVEAGASRGRTTIRAMYGDQVASAEIEVATDQGARFTLRPTSARLRPGEMAKFQAVTARGPVVVEWAADFGGVKQAGPGLFVAQQQGKGKVCGTAGRYTACASVVVTGAP